MTPHLSKLITAFTIYNCKRVKNSYCFLCHFLYVFIYIEVSPQLQSPPFDVLHHKYGHPSFLLCVCVCVCVFYNRLGNRGDMIMIECKQTIEMMKDNIIGPYEFRKVGYDP